MANLRHKSGQPHGPQKPQSLKATTGSTAKQTIATWAEELGKYSLGGNPSTHVGQQHLFSSYGSCWKVCHAGPFGLSASDAAFLYGLVGCNGSP